jgi:hypothetical protein
MDRSNRGRGPGRGLVHRLGVAVAARGAPAPDRDRDRIEHAFFPRNDRIQELLASKAHLIEGPPEGLLVPRSYVQFLQHHNDWKMRHLQWKEQGRPYPWCWTTSWPDSFYAEVWVTFETLARRHSEFLKLQRTQGLIEGGFRLPDYAHPGASETPAGARSAG